MESGNDNSPIDSAEELKRGVFTVSSLVNQLKTQLTGKKIAAKLEKHFTTFDARLSDFKDAYEARSDFDRINTCADHVNTYAKAISQSLNTHPGDPSMEDIRNNITNATAQLAAAIEDREVIFNPNPNESAELPIGDASRKTWTLERNNNKLKIENEEQRQAITANERKLAELEGHINKINSQIKEKLDQANMLYDSTLLELKKKETEISELVGVVSGKAIAGSYENSAATEKEMADYLRFGSLLCMFVIVFFVGYSFFETTTNSFKWETSAFRLVFAIFLSIPAAYLARESTKHRLQQYSHLQISLDLKAITPYIASLPIADQHRLKSEIANRLFAAKNHDQLSQESYPLNTHELLVVLINKLELPSKKDKEAASKS